MLRNVPQADTGDPAKTDDNSPRCPNCRVCINEKYLFTRTAFEPSEAELQGEDPPVLPFTRKATDSSDLQSKPRRSNRKRRVLESDEDLSDDDEDDDDLSDFIVHSDEDEEDTYVPRAPKKLLCKGKRAARRIIVDSDDEYDEDIIHGAQPVTEATPEEVALMPRFLPSTKMKVSFSGIAEVVSR